MEDAVQEEEFDRELKMRCQCGGVCDCGEVSVFSQREKKYDSRVDRWVKKTCREKNLEVPEELRGSQSPPLFLVRDEEALGYVTQLFGMA